MRISDWSSDVCSSDLALPGEQEQYVFALVELPRGVEHQFDIVCAADVARILDDRLVARAQISGELASREVDGSDRIYIAPVRNDRHSFPCDTPPLGDQPRHVQIGREHV